MRGRAAELPATLARCIAASVEAEFERAVAQVYGKVQIGELFICHSYYIRLLVF